MMFDRRTTGNSLLNSKIRIFRHRTLYDFKHRLSATGIKSVRLSMISLNNQSSLFIIRLTVVKYVPSLKRSLCLPAQANGPLVYYDYCNLTFVATEILYQIIHSKSTIIYVVKCSVLRVSFFQKNSKWSESRYSDRL